MDLLKKPTHQDKYSSDSTDLEVPGAPGNTGPSNVGRKDAKDIQVHAIPWEALQELGKVYHFGATARGYGDYNFRKGYDWTLTFDALMRHAFAFWNREENDPESGFNHMAHAAWHALTLCFFALTERGNDDRPN